MKKLITGFVPLLAFAVVGSPVAGADNDKPEAKESKKQMRVLSAPSAGARAVKPETPPEKETVTFLGVETSPASETLAAQLGLPRGAGLVVRAIIADSPAASVLEEHDILLKFEDQILIEQRQLAVLIRHRKAGDEVTLTFLRGGKQEALKVKLASREVPKMSAVFDFGPAFSPDFNFERGDAPFEFAVPGPHGPQSEAEVDHLLRLIQRGRGVPDAPPGVAPRAARIFVDREHGPGFRAMSVNPGSSSLVFSDDEGSLELTIQDGKKTLVAKDAAGKQLYAGGATTAEERAGMPENVRRRLEQLEGMQDVAFETDQHFQGARTKVIRPLGRGVNYLRPRARTGNVRSSM